MVSIVSAARDLGRIREVSAVLARHGFGEIVMRLGLGAKKAADASGEVSTKTKERASVASRIRSVLEDLGPSFVKLGQLASTRPDLLPPELISELKKLQDAVNRVGFPEIRAQIEASLGAPVETIFDSIEETPLAAGSIAQVHRARLKSEEEPIDVAVKVQRPGIASKIASDLDILHMFAALLERTVPETRIYSPIGLVEQFDQAITAELDFAQEAENARRFAKNFADVPDVLFPKVYREASSKQVITLEFIDGLKVNDALARGFSGKSIARLAFRTIIQQIYEDGFFHADPHPGNVFILGTPEEPKLAMIDLGMVGRMGPRMRDLTIDVVTGALRRDDEAIALALYEIGTPTKKVDMEAYKAEVAFLTEKLLGKSLKDLEMSELVRDLVRAATKYGITIPTDFVLMGKALVTIEGVGKEIDPHFDILEEARPLFANLLRKRYSPERIGNDLIRRIERLSGLGYNLPQQLEEILDDLRLGRLKIQVEDPKQLEGARASARHLAAAVATGALTIASALLFSAGRDRVAYIFVALAVLGTISEMAQTLIGRFRR